MHQQALYLEQDKADLLDSLSAEVRIPKAVLLREAVDDLLAKHGKLELEQYDELRIVLAETRALASKIETRGHEETATFRRAVRIMKVIDPVQEAFDKRWRFR